MFPLNKDHKPANACLKWAQDCLQQSVSTKALPAHAHQHKYHYTLQTEAGNTYLLVESNGNTGSVLKFIALSNRFRKIIY